MDKILSVKIRPSERAVLVGATGSGKTFLASRLVSPLRRVLVLDPKHTFKLEGFKPGETLPIFRNEFKMIFRPDREEDDGKMARVSYEIFKRGNAVIYVDELATLADYYPITTAQLADIARTGRERAVGVWSAMQRPRFVPKVFLTESEVFFIFGLRSADDRKHIAGFSGEEVVQALEPFGFWYVRPEMQRPRALKLSGEKFTPARQFVNEEV